MITGYFGLPGCGKSTFLAQIAKKYQKQGVRVFVNKDFPIDGCYLFDWKDIGIYDMSNSVILIDEVSIYADNRDFKEFNKTLKQFFILHRHYHSDIIWCTQQYDGVDRKIRELTTCLYYVKTLGHISYAMRVDRMITVDKETKQIIVGFKLSHIFGLIFAPITGSMKLCYRPIYYKHFHSFTAPKLQDKTYKIYSSEQNRSESSAGQ